MKHRTQQVNHNCNDDSQLQAKEKAFHNRETQGKPPSHNHWRETQGNDDRNARQIVKQESPIKTKRNMASRIVENTLIT